MNIEDIGFVHFRLHRSVDNRTEIDLIRADVRVDGPTIFVFLSPANNDWPFTIENHSDQVLEICQNVGRILILSAFPENKSY